MKIDRVEPPRRRQTVQFDFLPAPRSGEDVVSLKKVHKGRSRRIYEGFDFTVRRRERWCVMGINGAGKSTLLKLVAGAAAPDKGTVALGGSVKMGYFAQHAMDVLDGERTVFQSLEDAFPQAGQGSLRSLAGCFGFSGDDIEKRCRVLSGGEKARLVMALMLYDPPNFLVLDEPTNHLDMVTKEMLLTTLAQYEGTMLLSSPTTGTSWPRCPIAVAGIDARTAFISTAAAIPNMWRARAARRRGCGVDGERGVERRAGKGALAPSTGLIRGPRAHAYTRRCARLCPPYERALRTSSSLSSGHGMWRAAKRHGSKCPSLEWNGRTCMRNRLASVAMCAGLAIASRLHQRKRVESTPSPRRPRRRPRLPHRRTPRRCAPSTKSGAPSSRPGAAGRRSARSPRARHEPITPQKVLERQQAGGAGHRGVARPRRATGRGRRRPCTWHLPPRDQRHHRYRYHRQLPGELPRPDGRAHRHLVPLLPRTGSMLNGVPTKENITKRERLYQRQRA